MRREERRKKWEDEERRNMENDGPLHYANVQFDGNNKLESTRKCSFSALCQPKSSKASVDNIPEMTNQYYCLSTSLTYSQFLVVC